MRVGVAAGVRAAGACALQDQLARVEQERPERVHMAHERVRAHA